MSASYAVETIDSERVPATGTLPALRAIVLRRVTRREAVAIREAALPRLDVPFTPPAPAPTPTYFPERTARPPGTPKPALTPKYVTLTCSQCATSYRTRARFVQGERHYCGPDCRHKAWVAMRAERRRAGRPETRYCEECQRLIPPTPADVPYPPAQRFCSAPCQERAATRRQRQGQATHGD